MRVWLRCINRCLQEISYLTSPQAMNPLPNRPLLNNPTAPLSLPNVPSFDQMAYNGRPRKVLPEAAKEFPLLNGINPTTGPAATGTPSAGSQLAVIDRNTHLTPGLLQQQPPLVQLSSQNHVQPPDSSSNSSNPPAEKPRESESENSLTAIFRPDDAGEWKEKLRLSHEVSEKHRISRELASSESGPWEGQREDDEEVKPEEGEVEDDEGALVGDEEGTKLWKAKRTLRKSVS